MSVVVELQLNAVWVDITAYVFVDRGIEINHGQSGEANTADPSTCAMAWNNRDGRFSPRNPAGPYYGYLKRNTPLRVTVDGAIRYVGEVSEFPNQWDPAGAVVATPVVASGVLRRLAQGASTTSIIADYLTRRALTAGSTIVGYWPMEDGPDAQSFASAIGGPALEFLGTPVPAALAVPEFTTAPIATFEAAGAQAPVTAAASTAMLVGALISIPETGTTDEAELLRVYTAGSVYVWTVSYYHAFESLRVRAYARVGVGATEVLNQLISANDLAGTPRYVYLEAANSGANVGWFMTVLGGNSNGGTILTQTVGAPTYVQVAVNRDLAGDVGIGHLVVSRAGASSISSLGPPVASIEGALLGYTATPGYVNAPKDSVTERLTRLAADAGVAITVVEGTVVEEVMGADRPGRVLDRMRTAEAADAGGILSDDVAALGLRYATRSAIYSDTAAATPPPELDYDAGHLTPPLSPTDDDRYIRNDVTVSIDGGASGRRYLATGDISVNPYPAGIGRYEDQRELSLVYNADPVQVAGWILNVGTADEPRYPQITVDLVRNASLVAALNAIRPGAWLTLADLPRWQPPGDVDLVVLGWREIIGAKTRTITFTCAPAAPWRTFEIEDQAYGRLDSATTTVNEALDTTETGVDYTGDTWVTTATRPQDFPFDITFGGEVARVTSATAATFTVTRSVNGVVKSHAAGTPIRLARPVHLAL